MLCILSSHGNIPCTSWTFLASFSVSSPSRSHTPFLPFLHLFLSLFVYLWQSLLKLSMNDGSIESEGHKSLLFSESYRGGKSPKPLSAFTMHTLVTCCRVCFVYVSSLCFGSLLSNAGNSFPLREDYEIINKYEMVSRIRIQYVSKKLILSVPNKWNLVVSLKSNHKSLEKCAYCTFLMPWHYTSKNSSTPYTCRVAVSVYLELCWV